ncbi:MAG: hypothetical protein WCF94_02450 [bacterium]
MKQTFRSLLIVSIFVFGVGYLYAWTGPTAPAPDKNVAAPLNVGENEQIKKGNLILGGDSLSGNGLAKLQVTGASLLNGKVTITANTTDNPALVGKVFTLMDGNEGAGKVLTSDNNGVATWKEIATTSTNSLKSFSSDWFPVTRGTTYTIAHNLNSTDAIVQIYYKEKLTDTTTIAVPLWGEGGGGEHVRYVGCGFNLTNTSIIIRTVSAWGTRGYGVAVTNDDAMKSTGYYKVVMLKI